MEKKPEGTWADGMEVPQGSRYRGPRASGLGPGVLGFVAGVEVGNWLYLGPAGERARRGMSRVPGHFLMMSGAPEYGSCSWRGAIRKAGWWD